MSNFAETQEQYKYALKLGRKCFAECVRKGKSPYLEALDDIVNLTLCSSEYLGLIDIPSNLIIGTKTNARKNVFASNFLPICKKDSEFSNKWCHVCSYHLSDSGITDAPKAIEYLGKFYITEGNKRVSVLKSYGAPFISLDVTRYIPKDANSKAIRVYKEFLEFYKYSKLYSIQFSEYGSYHKFLKLMNFSYDYTWTRHDRIRLIGFFGRLEVELNKKKVKGNHSDCLLALMDMYGYEKLYEMKDKELDRCIENNKVRLDYSHSYFNIQCVADEEKDALYTYGKDRLKDVDFIISCGDLKNKYLENLVTIANRPLFYVYGNHDDYDVNPPEGCDSINDTFIVYKGIRILGLGGSRRYSNDKFQYTEKEMRKKISKLKWKIRRHGGVDIIVTHAPIKGFGDLDDYAHQGFECFKDLLEEFQPKYWLYGHVHLSYDYKLKRVIEYKNTKIVNCSEEFWIKY